MGLFPCGKQRDDNINFDLKLIGASKGLLAAATGQEKYLCELEAVGGPTPESTLSVADGMIDQQKLCTDSQLASMVDEG